MSPRLRIGVVVVLLAAAAFGGGYWVHDARGYHPPIVHAPCDTAADGDGSCSVGDWAYGIERSVPWTDKFGSLHEGGTPDCLPPLTEIEDLLVAADVVWIGDAGTSQVLWVDCRGH